MLCTIHMFFIRVILSHIHPQRTSTYIELYLHYFRGKRVNSSWRTTKYLILIFPKHSVSFYESKKLECNDYILKLERDEYTYEMKQENFSTDF